MLDRRALLRHAMVATIAGGLGTAAFARGGGAEQDAGSRLVTIPGSDSFDLADSATGAVYRISVALPGPGRSPSPVAVLLDPNLLFGLATDLTRALAASGDIPPLTLVGIGYPTDDPAEIIARRLEDYTFVPDEAHEGLVRQILGKGHRVRSGGGAAFFRFVTAEVLPAIARRYPAEPSEPTLIGHSLGGLFALDALFAAETPFARYAITSPPVLWAREAIVAREARFAETHHDLKARLFLGVGGLETNLAHVLGLPPTMDVTERAFIAAMGDPDPVAQLRRFDAALGGRGYPGLRSEFQVFAGESHASVPAPALARALPMLFAGKDSQP